MCRIPQGLSQARLPPAELLLPPGQLQQVTLLQVGTSLCRGCCCAQAWEGRQDITSCQTGEGEKGDGKLGVPACGGRKFTPQGWKEAVFIFYPLGWHAGPIGVMPPSYRVEDQGTYVARIGVEPQTQVLWILVCSCLSLFNLPDWESHPKCLDTQSQAECGGACLQSLHLGI